MTINDFLDNISNRKVALTIKTLMKEAREKNDAIPNPTIYQDSLEGYVWTMKFNQPLKFTLYIKFPNQDWEYIWWGFDMKEISPGVWGVGDNKTEGKGKFHLKDELASWMKDFIKEED